MATPDRESIDTFMSITGSSEIVALRKLTEHGGGLNEAVNSYFTEGDTNINETNVAASHEDFMNIDETRRGFHESDHPETASRIDVTRGTDDHMSVGISHDTLLSPSALGISTLRDCGTEEEMTHAAIEVSKRKAETIRQDDLSAVQENAFGEVEYEAGSSETRASTFEVEEVGTLASSNGRLGVESSSIQDETEDAYEQPLVRRRSRRVNLSSPSGPTQHQNVNNTDEWGGISSEEHDEAVMLEAAIFGGVPEGAGYRVPYPRNRYSRNRSGRTNRPYARSTPRPPSPTLTAQRLIREQQNDEYLASLQADREKELLEQAAREAAMKEEQRKLEQEQIIGVKVFGGADQQLDAIQLFIEFVVCDVDQLINFVGDGGRIFTRRCGVLPRWHGGNKIKDMKMEEMASLIGVSYPVFQFLVCYVATIPISFFHRFVPGGSTGKHLYAATTGAVLSYLAFGLFSNLHFLVSISISYGSMVICRKLCGLITFFLAMGYLIGCHVYYMSGDSWKEGGIDATGSMMVITLKVISCAINYNDGLLKEIRLRESQKKNRLVKLPSFIEFLGYCLCCGSHFAGPVFEMKDYLDWTEEKGIWIKTEKPSPSPFGATIKAILQAGLCMGVFLYLDPRYPVSRIYSRVYKRWGFIERLSYQFMCSFSARWKYYFIWSISEASMILSGLGFSGWTNSFPLEAQWKRAKNVDILGVEFAKSAVEIPLVWNIHVSTWLRHCLETGRIHLCIRERILYRNDRSYGFHPPR
ncbi:hypothetical protein E3N88_30510 [Mikania micrantha]|uniref:UBA domain-containing protein n=1 Tax=Mikania micrantha TaxID=192012 RepID=A0A5N6MMJ6_9ASTR|nr:hypothetical protein E3N88_30510 [Mikania micrantha]